MRQEFSVRHLQVLAGMTLVWGLNWPVMKYAVTNYPPLAFRTLCMLLGLVCMWGLAAALRVSLRIPRSQWGLVLKLALPNMIGWHLLCILGVEALSSGRAAILGYTMPVWAALAGLIWGQTVSGRGMVGLLLAMGGMLLLLFSEFSTLSGNPLGVMIMTGAAICWGLGTAMIRRFPVKFHPLAFTHAMMIPTILTMCLASLVLEGTAHGLPSGLSGWWPIVYNAVGVFAFCQVGWFFLASTLPPIASSLSVMLIPVVGVIAGAVALGETPHTPDYLALVLILSSMGLVLLKSGK